MEKKRKPFKKPFKNKKNNNKRKKPGDESDEGFEEVSRDLTIGRDSLTFQVSPVYRQSSFLTVTLVSLSLTETESGRVARRHVPCAYGTPCPGSWAVIGRGQRDLVLLKAGRKNFPLFKRGGGGGGAHKVLPS